MFGVTRLKREARVDSVQAQKSDSMSELIAVGRGPYDDERAQAIDGHWLLAFDLVAGLEVFPLPIFKVSCFGLDQSPLSHSFFRC